MDEKRPLCDFNPPPSAVGGLGVTYTVHVRLTRKLVVDLLFALNKLFPSLELVSHGASTDAGTPYFFLKKTGDLSLLITFAHHCHTVTLLDFTRVSFPGGCHAEPFYLSDLVSPLFFLNLANFFFIRVSPPPWRVSHGTICPRLP